MNRVVELGCIACRKLGYYDTPAGIHHIRYGQGKSQRASHRHTLGLCGHHHQTGGYGEAFYAGKKAWEAKFGTELELLQETYELLGMDENEINGLMESI